MTRRIRTLIVDDEAAARRCLRVLLDDDPDIEIVGECRNGPDAVAAVKSLAPDLVFLDVQMPGMNGFDVLTNVGAERMPVVVFVTAYDRYALRAFEAHALDYVLKPFTDRRFNTALQRAKTHLEQSELAALTSRIFEFLTEHGGTRGSSAARPQPEYRERIGVRSDERVFLLEVALIDWIEASGDYLVLHVGKQRFTVRGRMKDMETKLDPRRFVRIHRSAIVNIERVKELQPYFHGDYMVIMNDGTRLRLSRRRCEAFERLLAQPL
jgi:two-component system LytT family response regulator